MTNRLTLASGSTFSIGAGSSATTVFGTDGVQNLTIAAGATVTLDASFNKGGDTITLTGNAASYTVTKSGSSVILTDATGSITIPVGVTGMNIAFADAAARSLVSTTTGAFTLGTQSVTETAAALTAGSSAIVGQTFTLTTGVETLTGTAGNDTFTAAATSATTGLAATTINSGDTIVGGAGTDTLNIAVSATNNNSLTGLTVSGVETVSISNANFLGASSPAVATAEAAKAVTAATLTTRNAESVLASQQAAAAAKVIAILGGGANDESAAAQAAAVAAGTATGLAEAAAAVAALTSAADVGTASTAVAVPTGATAYTLAQYNAAALAALRAENGSTLTSDADVTARADELAASAALVEIAALSSGVTDLVAAQQLAAATAIAALGAGTVTAVLATAASTISAADFANLNTTAFTQAQYQAAALSALRAGNGAALTATSDVDARADALVTKLTAIAATAGDFTVAQLNTAATNATRAADGSSLVTPGDDSVAIATRATALGATTAAAATAAGNAAATALAADLAAANVVTVALAGVTANTLAASTFADATLISLSGSSGTTSVSAVAATQTIGFDALTLANTVTFGATVASGSLAINGSAGALTVTGNAMTALNVSGTGSTGLTITDAGTSATTAADPITTLNLSTTSGTVLDTSAMLSLATLTQTGAGGVTLTPGTRLGAITTGAGADTIRVSTATLVDNPGTTTVETINAVVNTGAGNDRLVIVTTGTGSTTVDAGDGNDTVFLTSVGSGTNSIALGAGDDIISVGAISNLLNASVAGGAGNNTLRTTTTAFSTANYATLVANTSGITTLETLGTTTDLDASFVSATTFQLRGGGVITEVASGDTVVVARTAAATATTGFAETAVTATSPSALTISSLGYVLDSNAGLAGNQTVFGDNLNVTLTQTAAATTVGAQGNVLNLSIAALAQSGSGTTASPNVTGIDTTATVTGDLVGLTTNLTSVRGSGTNGAGVEDLAGVTVAVVAGGNLSNLASISVTGSGVVTIGAGAAAATAAKLATINLSGMTAFANQNALGQEWDGTTVGLFQNLSTSSVTLNTTFAETVILGGAKDLVITSSTLGAVDTITGFQMTASVASPLLIDASRSDVLDLGTAGGAAFNGAAGGNAAKMVVTGSSLEAALLQAAGLKAADGTTNVENVVFHFGGDTYVYQDVGANGLTDGDFIVRLTGLQNLDLLIGGSVLGG